MMLVRSAATFTCLSAIVLVLTHCSSSGTTDNPATGGSSGGSTPSSGGASSGGTSSGGAGSGGAAGPGMGGAASGGASGGASSGGAANGGSPAAGGSVASGGKAEAAGGSATGGAASGGAKASGGAGGTAGAGGGSSGAGGASGGSGGGGAFAITSAKHAEGAKFADPFTCAGDGHSPPLNWTAGPSGTKSYAITFLDTTLTEQNNANGYHYVIWDIPADTLALPESLPSGASITTPVVAKQSSPMNPFDMRPANSYFGPCPNTTMASGKANDTYAFQIYALPVDKLTGTLTSVKTIEAAIKAANPLATAKLTGTSDAHTN